MSEPITRRSVLQGTGVFAVGGAAGFVVTEVRKTDASDTSGANAYGYDDSGGSGSSDTPLAKVDDIPDGGGLILDRQHLVLTRSGDTVKAFSATCTHQGCTVTQVKNGRISCPCHGSVFDASTGKVVGGPAPRPLPTVAVTVHDNEVFPA